MAGKVSKTSYTYALLSIPFIQLLNFYNARYRKIKYKVQITSMTDYLNCKCFYINYVYIL